MVARSSAAERTRRIAALDGVARRASNTSTKRSSGCDPASWSPRCREPARVGGLHLHEIGASQLEIGELCRDAAAHLDADRIHEGAPGPVAVVRT